MFLNELTQLFYSILVPLPLVILKLNFYPKTELKLLVIIKLKKMGKMNVSLITLDCQLIVKSWELGCQLFKDKISFHKNN